MGEICKVKALLEKQAGQGPKESMGRMEIGEIALRCYSLYFPVKLMSR